MLFHELANGRESFGDPWSTVKKLGGVEERTMIDFSACLSPGRKAFVRRGEVRELAGIQRMQVFLGRNTDARGCGGGFVGC
jgi:hypothetical protein